MTRLAFALVLASCSSSPHAPDARPADAALADAAHRVFDIACPTTAVPTVATTTGQFAYMPATTTIATGGIVKFTTSSEHDVEPNASGSDVGLAVDFNTTKCLHFTAPGSYGFHCGPHQFTGTIVVQ
jgi:plastocyanin